MLRGLQHGVFFCYAVNGIGKHVDGFMPARAQNTAYPSEGPDRGQKCRQLRPGGRIAEPPAGGQYAVPVVSLPEQHFHGHGPCVLVAIRVNPFQHQAPFVAVSSPRHAFDQKRRTKPDFLTVSVRSGLQLVQPGASAFLHQKKAFRHGAVVIPLSRFFHNGPDSLKRTQPVQVVEVRRLAFMNRADGQLAAHGLSRQRGHLLAGIPLCLRVVIGTEDDFTLCIPLSGHDGHGFQIPGVEGHKTCITGRQMKTDRCSIPLGNQQGTVFLPVFGGKGKEASRRASSLEKELVRTLGSLFRQDELQTLYPAGLVQNRDNQTPVFCPAQSDGRDSLPLQVGMVVPGVSGTVPDARGQFGGGLPAAVLLGFLVRFDGPDAFTQGIPFGGGQFFFWLVCPCTFIAGAPVFPPDGGRSIQKRLVRAVPAMGPVRCATAVQEAVGLHGLDLQPRCTQTLAKTVQNVGAHYRFLN